MKKIRIYLCGLILILIEITAGCGGSSSPQPTPETLWAESDTAANAAQWLKDLNITPSTDEVVSVMEVFHITNILDGETRRSIHSMGTAEFYNDTSLLDTVLTTLSEEYEERAEILSKLGIYLVRDVTAAGFWEVVEPSEDTYHDEIPDLITESYGSKTENYILINPYALWDQLVAGYPAREESENLYNGGDYFVLKENTGPGPVFNLPAFKNFLSHLESTYNLKYFEIANEPESEASGYYGSPEDYVALLQNSRAALGDEAVILNGGALEFTTNSTVTDFWNTFFAEGGDQYFDVMNLHYNMERSAQHDEATIDTYEAVFNFYNNLMDSHSGRKPIWFTEYGNFAGTQDGILHTEEFQAEWFLKYFSFGAARGLKKVFIDLIGTTTDIIGQSKLFYVDPGSTTWTARLLVYTVKLMNYKLTGFSNCEEIIKGQQYKYTVGDKSIYVLWGDSALPSDLEGRDLKVTDIYGNETTTSSLTLSDHPVVVEY